MGSEVFDCVCLPSSFAHVLMESALHYFNDPRLITEASITKTQAGLAEGWGCSEPCLTAFVRRWRLGIGQTVPFKTVWVTGGLVIFVKVKRICATVKVQRVSNVGFCIASQNDSFLQAFSWVHCGHEQ